MEGVEPTTPRLQITCSSQLSYIGIRLNSKGIAKIGIKSNSPKLFPIFRLNLQKIHKKTIKLSVK